MFIKNRMILSLILGATSLSFIGCENTGTSNPNDFSMCDGIGYTDTTNSAANSLSGDNPIITLYGDKIITVPVGTASILNGGDRVEVTDPQDGDLKSELVRTNDINLNQAGEYHIKYRVEDSDGNEDIKCRKIIVEGNTTNIVGVYDNGEGNYTYGDYTYDDYTYDNNNNNNGGYVEEYGEENQDNTYTIGTVVQDDSTEYHDNYSYGSEIDSFVSWYSNTCGRAFNSNLYDENTKTYKGRIDCSHLELTSIDLSPLSVFNGIDEIDLSYNKLTYIDFSPIRDISTLWRLNISYNTKTLKKRYDTKAERKALFRYFTNIHGGDGQTGLWIGFKPTNSDKEELRIRF